MIDSKKNWKTEDIQSQSIKGKKIKPLMKRKSGVDNDRIINNLVEKVNILNEEKANLEKALKIVKEQSMLSADQGEMMLVKMEKIKVEDGNTLKIYKI